MRTILLLILSLTVLSSYAQQNANSKSIERKGLTFGLGFGAGILSLDSGEEKTTNFSATLPNIKIGYMLNHKTSLNIFLPGATFSENDQDRGFEGITLAGQYWLKENWWILGGAGLTFDAPAFYEVENLKDENFNFGFPALTFSTGYELWRKGNFTIDLQYRLFYGNSNLPDSTNRTGISNMIALGINWY